MYKTTAIEIKTVENGCVDIGNGLSVVYIIDAELFSEVYSETNDPWIKNLPPGVYYSFIGAQFCGDDKIGESTMGRFTTLSDAKQFAASYTAACRSAA